MNVMKLSDRGVLAISEYWHQRMDDGTLMIASCAELWGSGAASSVNCLVRPYSDINFVFDVAGSSDMTVRILEAPTISGSGTAVTPCKLNRHKSDPTLGASFWHTAGLSATGVTLISKYIPSGVGKFGGGAGFGGGEWGFCAGTIYAFQIKAHAVGTFNLSFEYYVD